MIEVSPGDRFVGWIRHPVRLPNFFLLFCWEGSVEIGTEV